jgi:hypothetical protein
MRGFGLTKIFAWPTRGTHSSGMAPRTVSSTRTSPRLRQGQTSSTSSATRLIGVSRPFLTRALIRRLLSLRPVIDLPTELALPVSCRFSVVTSVKMLRRFLALCLTLLLASPRVSSQGTTARQPLRLSERLSAICLAPAALNVGFELFGQDFCGEAVCDWVTVAPPRQLFSSMLGATVMSRFACSQLIHALR